MVLLLVVACCCLLLLVVACCCLLLLVVACCCLLLLVVACCCLLVLVGACWCLLLLLLLCVLWVCCGCVQDFWSSLPDPPAGPPFPWTAQNFALFFSLPRKISFFLLSLGGLLVELWPLFKAVAHPKCGFRLVSFCETLAA